MKTTTNIPNKGYDPIVSDDWRRIAICTSSNDADDRNEITVKLPEWLRQLIVAHIDQARKEGRDDVRGYLRDALGI